MSEGRVNPMFPYNVMLTPFAFIMMIEIGSSPERIKDDTKSSQNGKRGELVNWFTQVLFDVKTGFHDHWVKLWIYRPVSLFWCKQSSFKFVNLTISGGIGPIQSQDKTAKKGRWRTGSPRSNLIDVEIRDHWFTTNYSTGRCPYMSTYQSTNSLRDPIFQRCPTLPCPKVEWIRCFLSNECLRHLPSSWWLK